MSWRANIPELQLLKSLTLIVDDLTKSYAKLDSTEKTLNDQLKQVNKDLKELESRKEDITVFEKKQVEAEIDEIDTETDDTNYGEKFDELVQRILDGADDVEEKAQLTKKIAELRLRKFQIENTEEIRISILSDIIRLKIEVLRTLVPLLSQLQQILEVVLDSLEKIIDGSSGIPVIGQIINAIVGLVIKIIDEKIYKPVKDANRAFADAIDVVPRIFGK